MSSARSTKVLVLTIGNGINVLINFLTLPYLVRTLSYLSYGTYGQVLLIISLIQGVFTFNLNQISNVIFSQKKQDPSLVFLTLFRISIGLSALGTVLMFVSIPLVKMIFDNELIPNLLLLSLINLFCQIPIPVFISVLIYFDRVKHTTSILVISNIVKVVAMFIAIYFFNSVELMMIGLSISSLIQAILLFLAIPKKLRKVNAYDSKIAASIFKMASPLVLSSFIEKSLFYIDGLMISTMLGTTAYAFYRAGAIEVPFIATLYGAVATIVMPEVAKYFEDKNYKEIVRLKKTAISTTVFFVYPVFMYLLFFSNTLVSFYLSEKYVNSVMVFLIFNLSLLVRINDYQDVIIVSGNSKYIFKAVLISTLLNIVLNYVLIHFFGIEGSAMSFVICLIVFSGLLTLKSLNIMQCKFSDLFNISLIAKVVLISLIPILLIYSLQYFFFSSVWFVIFVAPFYAGFVLLAGIKYDLLHPTILNFLAAKFNWVKK